MLPLGTKRLIIRPFVESDYKDLHEYLSLSAIYEYEPDQPVSLDEARQITIERSKGTDFLAAILKSDMKLIGHVYLGRTEPKEFDTHEIGYIFNPAYWNRGFATEATRAVIRYIFSELNAHRIIGHCNPRNIASWRVLEKCGMTREGTFRRNVFFRRDASDNPVWTDTYEYALLRDDYSEVGPSAVPPGEADQP